MITAAMLALLLQASPVPSPQPSPGPSPAAAPRVAGGDDFPGADGIRLFHRRVGTGEKVVVFLNGGAGTTFAGTSHIEQLATSDRSVVLYDARGSGASDLVVDPGMLTAEHHRRDLEALRLHLGVERMSLVALGSGVPFAAWYATGHPGHLDRLVLVNPGTLDASGLDIERLGAPALVVDGTKSDATPGAAREWAAALPNAWLLLIPGAGPDVIADQPVPFTAAARQFLSGRIPAGAEVVPGPDAH